MKFLLLNLSFLILKEFRAMGCLREDTFLTPCRGLSWCVGGLDGHSIFGGFFLFLKKRGLNDTAILQCRHRMGIMALKDDCSWGCLCWHKLLPPWFLKGELCPLHSLCYLSLSVVEWNGRLIRDIGRNTVKRIFVLFTSEKNATAKSEILNSFSRRLSIVCGFQVCVFWYESSIEEQFFFF